MIVVLIVAAVLALLFVLWLWAIAPRCTNKPDLAPFRKYDYAHRGLHNRENGVPENSLTAFSLAVQCGFGMELDLQLTRDKKVVVHHDHSIERTCGADKRISDLTLNELREYRLFGTEECVPLFSEMLRIVEGRTPLIIELKGYNDPEELCPLVMKELEGYKGLYCVESFDPRIVRWFRKNRPKIVRGQLMARFKKGEDGLTAAQAFFGRNLLTNCLTRPDFEAYDFHGRNILPLKAVRGIFGMQEVSWTLRTREDLQKAKALHNLCIFERVLPEEKANEKQGSYSAFFENYQKAY